MSEAMSTTVSYRTKYCQDNIIAGSVKRIAFCPEGRLIAITDSGGDLLIIDSAAGVLIHHAFFPSKVHITAVLWTSNLELLYGCSDGQAASLKVSFVAEESRVAFSGRIPLVTNTPAPVISLAISSAAETHLVVGTPAAATLFRRQKECWVLLRSVTTQAFAPQTLVPRSNHLVGLAFMGSGNVFLAYKYVLRMWNIETGAVTVLNQPRSQEERFHSFVSCQNGALLMGMASGAVILFQVDLEPPFGLTQVQSWSAINKGPRPMAIYQSLSTCLVALTTTQGLNVWGFDTGPEPQADPDQVAQFDHESNYAVAAVDVAYFEGHLYIATVSGPPDSPSLRVEIKTSDPTDRALPRSRPKRYDLSHLANHYYRMAQFRTQIRALLTFLALILFAAVMLQAYQDVAADVRYQAIWSIIAGTATHEDVQDLIDAGWIAGIPRWYSPRMIQGRLRRDFLGF